MDNNEDVTVDVTANVTADMTEDVTAGRSARRKKTVSAKTTSVQKASTQKAQKASTQKAAPAKKARGKSGDPSQPEADTPVPAVQSTMVTTAYDTKHIVERFRASAQNSGLDMKLFEKNMEDCILMVRKSTGINLGPVKGDGAESLKKKIGQFKVSALPHQGNRDDKLHVDPWYKTKHEEMIKQNLRTEEPYQLALRATYDGQPLSFNGAVSDMEYIVKVEDIEIPAELLL